MSGKASLKKNLEELGLSLSPDDQAEVLKRIVSLGDSKRTITVEDLPFIIADVLERKDFRHIELLNCSITSELDHASTVEIRVNVNGVVHEASGSGNGGFDAFVDAIRKVFPPGFEFPELVDYELRIPKGGSTSALTEVFITWRDGPAHGENTGHQRQSGARRCRCDPAHAEHEAAPGGGAVRARSTPRIASLKRKTAAPDAFQAQGLWPACFSANVERPASMSARVTHGPQTITSTRSVRMSRSSSGFSPSTTRSARWPTARQRRLHESGTVGWDWLGHARHLLSAIRSRVRGRGRVDLESQSRRRSPPRCP